MKLSKIKVLVVVTSMALGFAARAVTEDPADHDLGVEPIGVTLAEGETTLYSGVLSGTGGVTLSSPSATTMGGAIRLSGNNTFEGGVTVNGGTVFAEHVNALGTGPIVLNATISNSDAGLVLAADNATIGNAITLNGNRDAAYKQPDILISGDDIVLNGELTLQTQRSTIALGAGTAANPREATIDVDDMANATNSIFLKVGGSSSADKEDVTAKLHWKTRLGTSSGANFVISMATTLAYGQLLIYSQDNELSKFNMGYASVVCMAKNVFGNQNGRACCLDCGQAASSDQYGYFDLNGYDQCAAYLGLNKSTDAKFGPDRIGPEITSKAGPATLRLYRNTDDENVTSFALAGQVSILLDGKSKITSKWAKQYFANRTHSTSGDLIVSNGTLGVTMATTFTNLKRIIVGRRSDTYGTFASQTTCDHAFPKLEELIVDGVFTHTGNGTDIFPTDGTMSLTITENGSFSMPAGTVLNVKEATLGTTTYTTPGTVLTSSDSTLIPEGVTIKVLALPYEVTTDDMTAQGDWTVTVDEGKTNIVMAAQTGSGKIIKKGDGYLILKAASTFTGGVQIDEGMVVVAKEGALGSGDVRVACSTKETHQLRFDLVEIGAPSTFENDIVFTGNSASKYEALYFVYPTANTAQPTSPNEPWTVTFTGAITSTGNLYIRDNRGGSTVKDDPNEYECRYHDWVVFNGPVSAPGKNIYFTSQQAPCGDVVFNGKVTAAKFFLDGYNPNNVGGSVYFNAKNDLATNDVSYSLTFLGVEDALGDPLYAASRLASASTSTRVYFEGHDQHFKAISSSTSGTPGKYEYGFYTDNASPASTEATLTIDGGDADSGQIALLGFYGKMTLVLDAKSDDFVQSFKGTTNGLSGAIIVKKGTLKFTAGCAFKNLPKLDIQGGSFVLEDAVPNAFASLTDLTVGNGGTFKTDRADVFKLASSLTLTLEKGATLDVPADSEISAAHFIYDGVGFMKGTYTNAQIPELPEGVTLNVTKDTLSEAEWTGAGEDNLTTTLANWLIDGVVPTKINTKSGSLNVTLTGGDGIQYADGDTFHKIVNTIPVTNLEGVVASTFVIEPVTEGATLTLVEGLNSTKMTQIKLCGHIQGPDGDVTKGEIFYYCAACTKDMPFIQPTSKYGSVAPLVLDNVTIDMPLRVQVHANATGLMADGGGTSVVNGSMRFTDYRAYASVEKDTELVFNGKVSTDNCYSYCGPGRTVFTENDLKFTAGVESIKSGYLVLAGTNHVVTGNKSREGATISSGTFELLKSGTFVDDVQLVIAAEKSILEINGTQQVLGRLNSVATKNTSYLHGDYPAMIELTCKVRSGATETEVVLPYCSARVTGGLGFHLNDQDGGTNVFTLAGRDFESCGDLVVSAGTMELAADATWLNGTNFTTKGEGVLKFAAKGQVNSGHAVLHLADDGKIYIPEDVTLNFVAADLGGEELPAGKYTGAEGVLKDRIIGGGTLRIGKRGMAVLIQ